MAEEASNEHRGNRHRHVLPGDTSHRGIAGNNVVDGGVDTIRVGPAES